jgi:hypothetical protein
MHTLRLWLSQTSLITYRSHATILLHVLILLIPNHMSLTPSPPMHALDCHFRCLAPLTRRRRGGPMIPVGRAGSRYPYHTPQEGT